MRGGGAEKKKEAALNRSRAQEGVERNQKQKPNAYPMV
jgi:hypothetical protein